MQWWQWLLAGLAGAVVGGGVVGWLIFHSFAKGMGRAWGYE